MALLRHSADERLLPGYALLAVTHMAPCDFQLALMARH